MLYKDDDDFFVSNNGSNKNKTKYEKIVTNDKSDNSKDEFKSNFGVKLKFRRNSMRLK